MANTISTTTYREKWFRATLQEILKRRLVAEAICDVDRSDSKSIKNPYASDPTVTVQALAGTYTPADFTTTDDTLSVTDEFIAAEHIMDFQSTLSNYDLFSNRMERLMYKIADKIDEYVINVVTDTSGVSTYTTPAGGFTAANFNTIMGNLVSKTAGYAETYNGLALVVENTDVPGIVTAQMSNGFSFADAALSNGFMKNYMGVDIYVVRSGLFKDATIGTATFTNAGHRLFMVKKAAIYAQPRGIQYEEKAVSGKTGKEVVAYGYVGAKVWTQDKPLVVDITLA